VRPEEDEAKEDHTEASGTRLRIELSEGGTTRVSLEFPGCSVYILEDLIPDSTMEVVRAERIDLREIRERALARSLTPGPLHEGNFGHRKIRIWLEKSGLSGS